MSTSRNRGFMGVRRKLAWIPALVFTRLRLIWLLRDGGAPLALLVLVLFGLTAIMPVVGAFVAGNLIGQLLAGPATGEIGRAVAGVVGVLAGTQAIEILRNASANLLRQRIDGAIRHTVRIVALAPWGIGHLESPEFQDDAIRASDAGRSVGRLRSAGAAAIGQLALFFRLLSAFFAALLLARLSVLLAVFLFVTALQVRRILRRQWIDVTSAVDATAPGRRRLAYWAGLPASSAAKEVRLLGLTDWLVGRIQALAMRTCGPAWRELHRILRRQRWAAAALTAASVAGLLAPAWAVMAGTIGADQLVTYIIAAGVVLALANVGNEIFDIEYGSGSVAARDRLVDRYQTDAPQAAEYRSTGGPVPSSGRPALCVPVDAGPPLIRFDQVTFCYPGHTRPVLRDLSLSLHPGETLAMVGRNGAGKSTIVKLLAALYRPTAGRITVDGIDLATMDVHSWRSQLAVLFQDFVRYPATVAANVEFGAVHAIGDQSTTVNVLDRVGLPTMVSRLDEWLWREARGGTDLSGGQWQRIATARALFGLAHGRRVLVLDEPTAHLDAVAEASFHERIIVPAGRITTLLISHRFSTICAADRIVMLQSGRVIEEGSHAELIGQHGEYARMFHLQASAYRDDPSVDRP